MKVCRTCLSAEAEKDITQLSSNLEGDEKSYQDIMLYCIGLQVSLDSNLTTKLCLKCYNNILSFHKFKYVALKSDTYLRTLLTDEESKDDVLTTLEIKFEDTASSNGDHTDNIICETDIGLDVKEENTADNEEVEELQSDDELLSVIKRIKYENGTEETKENEYIAPKTKKKQKRKKKSNNEVEKQQHVCEECGKTVINLRGHMYLHRPDVVRKRYKCKLCDKMFSSTNARHKHYKIKHLGIKKHCDICNKDVVSLSTHQLVIHNRKSLPYECVPCGRRFISKSQRDLHMSSSHTKERPFACDQCDKAFFGKVNLDGHRRQVHNKERSHLCQYCSKSFFKKYHLQVHLRSHSKEKPYECPDCGKFFTTTSVLKSHRLIHNDVKNYACELCDRTFVKPNYLRIHMISHTKVKRYPCKYCGVKFGRSDHRLRHQRTAHERHLTAA